MVVAHYNPKGFSCAQLRWGRGFGKPRKVKNAVLRSPFFEQYFIRFTHKNF
jgi:hypothetical protein